MYRKYGLKIIIDLHAAPGSQNGFQHSGSRDGSLEWGTTDESINQTIYVIDFLSARFITLYPNLYFSITFFLICYFLMINIRKTSFFPILYLNLKNEKHYSN